MNTYKKLRISEISQGAFIIERYDEGDPGKWTILNLEGNEKIDKYTDHHTHVYIDPCVYKDLESAEKAMNNFLIYPKVVRVVSSNDVNTDNENLYNLRKEMRQRIIECNNISTRINAAIRVREGLKLRKGNDNLDNPI